MKKYIFTILAILLLLIGCDTQTVVTKGEISVNINGRSIDPISMETEYYKVSVSSGENIQSVPRVEKDTGTVRFNVDAGSWNVCVEAYNNHGDLIGKGDETVSVSDGYVTQCSITVEEIIGTGTFSFNYFYVYDYTNTDSNPNNRTIKAVLSSKDGSEYKIFEGGLVSFEHRINNKTVVNGYYVFELFEKLSDELYIPLYAEEVRVIAGCVTSLKGRINVSPTPSYLSFEKLDDCNTEVEQGVVKINIDNTNIPINSEIRAGVVGEVLDNNCNIQWYINDTDAYVSGTDFVLETYRFNVGDIVKLSVIVTKHLNGVTKCYTDYCFFTVGEEVELPILNRIKSINGNTSLVYNYSDENFEVVCPGTLPGSLETINLTGDWYVNGELIYSNKDSLKLDDLTTFGMLDNVNSIEFIYKNGNYTKSTTASFAVFPDITSITFNGDNAVAGRAWNPSLSIKSNPGNALDKEQLRILLKKGENTYYLWKNWHGLYEFLPDAGEYEVWIEAGGTDGYYLRSKAEQSLVVESPISNVKDLEINQGDYITYGSSVDICIPYNLGENVEEIKWFLDDEVIVNKIFRGSGTPGSLDYIGPDFNDYTDKNNFLSFGPLDWPIGKHEIKAEVKTKDDINPQVFVKEITVVGPLTSFNINFIETENGKISFQILPSSSEYTEYETTILVNGSEYKTIGKDWKELEEGSSEYFNYSYHVTYKDKKDITYHYDDYGDYSTYSKNDYLYLSLDKYIYKPSDYIVFDLHAPALSEGYIFMLDDEEIDIDYDGDGEYLLPRVEGLGSHTLSIWSPYIEEPIISRSFVVSETGFISEAPKEVYQRLVIALPNNSEAGPSQYSGEGNGGSKGTGNPGFGLEASYESLIIYDKSYAVYGFAASQGPIIDGGKLEKVDDSYTLTSAQTAVTYKKNTDGNLCDDEGNVVYEKMNGAESDEEGYLGSWKFAEIRPDAEVLNALLSAFVPNEGMPFDSLVEFGEGEGVGLNLQFEIGEEWITAYIDLDLDATALDGQISLAPGFKLHLSGKAEYDVYDEGCLSIIGNGLPIYIQPSKDGSVLLIHLMIHAKDGNFMSIAVPLTRTEGVKNPVDVEGEHLLDSNYITLDSLYSFLKETTDLVKMDVPVNGGTMEIPGSALISSMYAAGPVEIAKVGQNKESFNINPGKWRVSDVTMDEVKEIVIEIAPEGREPLPEAIEKQYGSMCLRSVNETDDEDINKAYNDFRNIFGSTLYVMMNRLEFLDDSSWLDCSRYEEDINEGLIVFRALERIGGSQIVFTPMKQQKDGTIFVQVEYHKFSHPVKKGFLKLELEKEPTDITFLYDYFSSYTKLGLKVDSNEVYIEFGNDGNIWYKVGEQSYKVASYVLKNKENENSIIIKTDSSTILDLIPSIEKPEGVGLDVGIVLPFDSKSNKIVFFEGKESQKTGIKLVDLNNQV